MFIDTDTATDVRNLVALALQRAVNSLNSDISAYRRGSTSVVPKAQLKRKAIEMAGSIDMYFTVFHWGEAEGFDPALVDAANAARQAVAEIYGKTKI